tara:strand:- start:83 stop:1453 length:1371 start_codon:yes stop_codon:yes gene_type:complete
MNIYLYPKWNISIWYHSGSEVTNLIESLNNLYIANYNDNIKNYNNISYQKIISDNIDELIQSIKIGIILEPLVRLKNLFKLIKKKDNDNTNDEDNPEAFLKFVNSLLSNTKNLIYNSNSELSPQWYLFSDGSNKTNIEYFITIKNYSTKLNTYLNKSPEFRKLINLNLNLSDFNKFNEINKSLEAITSNSYYDEIIEKVRYLYQNDYYYFEEFGNQYYPLKTKLISELRKIKKKKPIFTIITPTLGNKSIINLKQVLKQEQIEHIHIILWDTHRVVENNKMINPNDLEDENTYCYQFVHPYFKYNNQRNDVWLRGVGISLTNTPYITFFDDDTWPERNHLTEVFNYMASKSLDYTYVSRMMWENLNTKIGEDNFEAIGVKNKFGFRLIDNSSLYMKEKTSKKVMNVFLSNQVYGDDRLTPDYLDSVEDKGEKMKKVLVNHIAKPQLLNYFKSNILS